jgi:hypothetical protein
MDARSEVGGVVIMQAQDMRERGGSKLNLLITLAILGSLIFGAAKLIPPYFANYQLQDAIESESRFALTGYPKKTVDDIRDDVFNKAVDLGVPASKDNIEVDVQNGSVSIAMDYSVPIDLKVYQFTLQFHPHADNHSI